MGVCQDDIAARVGNRPFLPKVPFVPGSSRPLLLSRHTALHARSPRSEAEWEWVQVFPRAFAFLGHPRLPGGESDRACPPQCGRSVAKMRAGRGGNPELRWRELRLVSLEARHASQALGHDYPRGI